ncbi:hypothetical protein D5045_05690 [Verminephrobacter eiseniae]|nr:hypothetical protein [Verminephrobacter eiseniae]
MLLDPCITEAGFVLVLHPDQRLPLHPQTVTVELAARFLKSMAAFTSRSCAGAHTGQVHWRCESGKAAIRASAIL